MNRTNKIRIAIVGVGGIGGYIGGKLAHYYFNKANIEIIFICRGTQNTAIKANGLELLSNNEVIKCYPDLVSFDSDEIGIVDVCIICTKNYSVNTALQVYAKCISSNTIIITTQNTVNGNETITPFLPKGTTLLEGSIYIASNIISPGKVHHVSGPSKLFFGTNGDGSIKGEFISKLFNEAGIETTFTNSIKNILWKKFMFVSPTAIVTAIFQITFSEIKQNKEAEILFTHLTSELMLLAKAKSIEVDINTIENNLTLLDNFSKEVKSTFQLDLAKSKPNEIESLVKYVIKEAKKINVSIPHYKDALKQLEIQYNLNS